MIFCESSWLPPPPDRFQWMNNLSRIWILRSAEAGPSRDVTHNIRSQDSTLYTSYTANTSLLNHALFTIASVILLFLPFQSRSEWYIVAGHRFLPRQKFYKMCPELRFSVRTEEVRVNKFQCLPFLYAEPDTKLVKRQKNPSEDLKRSFIILIKEFCSQFSLQKLALREFS